MKEGLIRLTDEKDIFYDSIEKVYRYRMHCPKCGQVSSTCRCYHELDALLGDIDDGIANYTCSAKCALLLADRGNHGDVGEAMQAAGIYKNPTELIKTLSDEQLKDYLQSVYEGCRIRICWEKHNRESMLVMLKENELEVDIVEEYNIYRGKSVQELTEEEAKVVLGILTEDSDFDGPYGEDCSL